MKGGTKKKPRGVKHKIRKERKREQHTRSAVIVVILIVVISVSGFFIYSMLGSSSHGEEPNPTSGPKAAIVDQLSLTFPNQTFNETATNILKQAGYTVDYYPGEEVDVEFYGNLPTHGYDLIILRVHSTASLREGEEVPVVLFTCEPYSQTKYVYEQLTNQIKWVAYSQADYEEGILYFGIDPRFVTQSMKGSFQNTVIIMMGCEGLDNTLMAEALVEKGAKVYISWNKPISASHTDLATTHLLQHFLIEKRTIEDSLRETFKEVGFDLLRDSLLIFYPLEVGDQTIENITGNPTTKP